MKISRYENQICKINIGLLGEDEYCFSVLARILRGVCKLTLTDNERIIICHSSEPFPVWIWQPNDASSEEMEFAYQLIKENFSPIDKYKFNVKYSLADFIIKRASEDGYRKKILMNMFAYSCPSLIKPKRIADGECRAATADDVQIAADFFSGFHDDVGIDRSDMEAYREKARTLIDDKRLFFWYDGSGDPVAMTSYYISEDNGHIATVFTRRDKRRCGYASNLVYAVTSMIIEQGKTPTLYTDADYAASNACYESIGYVKQGSI